MQTIKPVLDTTVQNLVSSVESIGTSNATAKLSKSSTIDIPRTRKNSLRTRVLVKIL